MAALRGRHRASELEGDIEYVPMLAGESCGVVKDIKPAAQIVKDLVHDAETALAEARRNKRVAPKGGSG